MKIAFVSPWYWPAVGGTETAIATLAYSLHRRGHQVVVHTRPFARAPGVEEDPHGIKVVRHHEWAGGAFWPAQANKADVVHLHGTDRALLSLGAAVLKKPFLTLHNGLGRRPDEYVGQNGIRAKALFDRIVSSTVLKRFEKILCLHEEERTRLAALCGSDKHLTVVPNAVAEDLIEYRSSMSPCRTDNYFMALGRLAPAKGMDVLIRAAGRGHFRLVIAGDGDPAYRTYLHDLAASLGADVSFAGYVYGEEKYRLLASARALLVGSPHEGLSIAILEAMALGVPVVAAPGASRELIEDGVTGWNFEWPSIDSLLSAVVEVERDGPVTAQIVERARAMVDLRYHPHVVTAQHEALYASVL